MATTVEEWRLVLDGKRKARPPVALIVVVGVEVKGASREPA
jgi:hypothetical protein